VTAQERAKRQRERVWAVARHAAVLELNGTRREALVCSRSVRAFAAWLTDRGIDPATYGVLAVVRAGGRPRVNTRESEQRQRRYRLLRDLGLSALEATRCACTAGVFRYTLRRMGVAAPAGDYGLDSAD
jgi:hypothetical protein